MVEEDAVTLLPNAEATSLEQLAAFDLDTLVSGTVRLRADRVAIADSAMGDATPLSFAEFDRRVSALADCWLDLGLQPGERILVAGGAAATSVIALIAALRAGLDVAFAPLHLSGEELVDFTCDTDAVALAADAGYGERAPADEMLSVASQAPRVRFVCSLGGGHVDGAVDTDPGKLTAAARRNASPRMGAARVLTRAANGEVVVHRQQTLVAAALDLVTRARIGMRLPIVATIAPVTFAGIVAGPIAALLAGAPLLLHGPFTAAGFTALLRRAGPAHLVAPAAMLPALQSADLLAAETLASLILVARRDDLGELTDNVPARDGSTVATGEDKAPLIVDFFAIGEYAAVPEARGCDGRSGPALAEPHYISFDDRRILAAGRGADSALEGAAVTDGSESRMEARARM